MGAIEMDYVMQDGREMVLMDREAYEDLVDGRQHAEVMARIAAGEPTFTPAEADAYLAAPTPLSFWRKRSGKTQATLAAEVGVSQPFLAQIEVGKRDGTVSVLARIAGALKVRIEDLVVE